MAGRHFALASALPAVPQRHELVQSIAAQTGPLQPVAEQRLAPWDNAWAGPVELYETEEAETLHAAEAVRRFARSSAGWGALALLLGAGAARVASGQFQPTN